MSKQELTPMIAFWSTKLQDFIKKVRYEKLSDFQVFKKCDSFLCDFTEAIKNDRKN